MRLRSLAKQPISPFLCQLEFLFLKIYHTMFAFNNNLSSLLPLPSKRLVSHLQAALNFTAKTIHFRLKTIAKYFICDLLAIISAIKYLCRAEKKNSIIKCAIFTISLVFLLPFSSPWWIERLIKVLEEGKTLICDTRVLRNFFEVFISICEVEKD